MWPQNAVTRRLGLDYPIIQGPFGGGLSSAKLLVTVSKAGGLGSFGVHHLGPMQIRALGADLHAQTTRPFALNLWVSSHDSDTLTAHQFSYATALFKPYFEELGVALPTMPEKYGEKFDDQIEALLEVRPAAFSFVYGIPSADILAECRRREIVTIGTITTVDEAIAMENAGVDFIVATGMEAGGHRVSFLQPPEDSLTGTFALIPTVTAKVKTPVIAAGGIANARGMAAAFMLGAQAVQIGSAFLACEESNASKVHRDALFSEKAKYTILTRAFTGRLARGIRNRLAEEMHLRDADVLPYPIQSWFTGGFKPAAMQQGRPDLMSLWAGQIAPLLQHRHAQELFAELVNDTNKFFSGTSLPSTFS